MFLDKTLLLKGLAGVAAVGGAGTTYIFRKELGIVSSSDSSSDLSGLKPEEIAKRKEDKKNEINGKLTKLGIDPSCNLEISNFPNEKNLAFSKECDLNKEKLQKIKFSNKGDNDVTVSGLDTGTIKLNISNKNDGVKYTFSGAPSRITISGDSAKTNISIGPKVEKEFEEKDGKLAKVSKTSAQDVAKIKGANGKLASLKIPSQCRFEEEDKDTSIDCDFSNKAEELKKIEFYNKGKSKDLTISGQTTGLKLTINRLSEEEGKNKYGDGVDLEFFFSGYSNEIRIQGDSSTSTNDIVLKQKISTPLTISTDNKLAKYFTPSTIDLKLNLSCSGGGSTGGITCTPLEGGKKIKFLNSEGTDIESEITVETKDKDKQILTATENTENYELGIKFTAIQDFPSSSSSPKLEANACYEAKYIPGKDKGWGLFKRSPC